MMKTVKKDHASYAGIDQPSRMLIKSLRSLLGKSIVFLGLPLVGLALLLHLSFNPSALASDAVAASQAQLIPGDTRSIRAAPISPISRQSQQVSETVRFAVIGDFGDESSDEGRVATMVTGWNPDFIITTGDNNYSDGEASTIDINIGQYYSQFIGNYQGTYGPGSETNRFWPSLGNHDWHSISCNGSDCSGPFMDYFVLPGNERYYEVDLGLVHLYAVDSDGREPDGDQIDSVQGNWLKNALTSSTSCFDVVYFHHPPFSSGNHGSDEDLRWPFELWGADVVLSGHEHSYERLDVSGFPYFVNGLGGRGLRGFDNVGTLPTGVVSVTRYSDDYGAMLVEASSSGITYQFFNADGDLIDELKVNKNCGGLVNPSHFVYLPAIFTPGEQPSFTQLPLGASYDHSDAR